MKINFSFHFQYVKKKKINTNTDTENKWRILENSKRLGFRLFFFFFMTIK